MCRRCKESDKRGPAWARRKRKQAALDRFGDGETCPCTWQYPGICTAIDGLTFKTMTMDRLGRGSSYYGDNCVPSCMACNFYRYLKDHEVPVGCSFGPVVDEDD